MSQIVDMILDAFKKTDLSRDLGDKLFDTAEKKKSEEMLLAGKDPDIPSWYIEKVNRLKQAETEGDLAYFGYESWQLLPTKWKMEFAAKMDPLFWNGVFFRYSDFLARETELFSTLPQDRPVMSIHEERVRYRFMCVDIEKGSIWDFMKRYEWKHWQYKMTYFRVKDYYIGDDGQLHIVTRTPIKEPVVRRRIIDPSAE